MNVTLNDTGDSVHELRLTATWKIHEYVSISVVALFVPIMLCSNIMVVMSVIKFKRLQIPTNYFIMSLAVADIVIALALPFYVTMELTPIKISNNALCLAANRTLMTVGGVSILTLAIIAFDRFTAIVRPLDYIMYMTKKKIYWFVSFSWIYSIAVSWLPIISGWHGNVTDNSSLCSNSVLNSKARIIYIVAIFLPACVCILFCYFRIFKIARHHAHAIAAMENSLRSSIERQFVKSDTKYAKTIAVVIGVFLSLWLPYQICLFIEFVNQSSVNYWVKNYFMLVAFSNSLVNPWVYAYQNTDFRSAFKKISEAWKCKENLSIEDRRTSIISQISVIPSSSYSGRLNRANSRVVASDILYTLSQQLGKDNIEIALNRRLSTKQSVVNAVGSLPDLIRMYANTYSSGELDLNRITELTILEESTFDEQQTRSTSRDSAFISESSV